MTSFKGIKMIKKRIVVYFFKTSYGIFTFDIQGLLGASEVLRIMYSKLRGALGVLGEEKNRLMSV
jgi:hypothetical protein